MTRDLLNIAVGVFAVLAFTGNMIQFVACGLIALLVWSINS